MADDSFKNAIPKIENKWQSYWDKNKIFKAANPGEKGSEKPKFYCLDMFPYPSGEGLHIGHPLGYTATDILSRFKRMQGYNVLHPMGWDAFGLPAEQHAIKTGVHPAITTEKNIGTFKKQLKSLGFSFDWEREISTADPSYYKWTQWIFKRLVELDLAYEAEVAVNWCAELGTVLANDEVIDGKSERGGHPVVRMPMRQWMLRITAYAEELLEGLNEVDWPESTKEHQRHWIGKSEGAKVRFEIDATTFQLDDKIEVFTTRPDTLFGVSFMALAPEHPLISKITVSERKNEVEEYQRAAAAKNDLQRTDLAKAKSGVFSGAYALHPLTQKKIPIWIADYVLMTYGTGAVMGVPAHDERDREFAEKYSLPIDTVISEDGHLINSPGFNGLAAQDAAKKITFELSTLGRGEKCTTYRLRDWVFSRQRYWGEPIPVVHVEDPQKGSYLKVLEDFELPLELPKVEKYQPTGSGESPLAAVKEWVEFKRDGLQGRRETNTMPGSAGSSWYWLRYMDPRNANAPWSKEAEKYWGQVDLYLGGAEHAVGHLLYSRFWHKVFHKLGLVSTREPFKKLVHQGMILGEDNEKMSKSRGNVVNPDDVVRQYGADCLRLFEMFLGPLEKAKPWQTANIEGVYRFLSRYWRLCIEEKEASPEPSFAIAGHVKNIPESDWSREFTQSYHRCIKQVATDIEKLSFNTAISALMILLNSAYDEFNAKKSVPREFVKNFTLMLAPFAPHLCEEVWEKLGHGESLACEPWPKFDEAKTLTSEIELPVQINGKLRDRLRISVNATEDEIKSLVLARPDVQKWLDGKTPKKIIFVKGKLISLVV